MKNYFLGKAIACAFLTLASLNTLADWEDIQSGLEFDKTRPTFDRINRVYAVNVTITNTGASTLSGPFRLLIEDSTLPLVNASGATTQGVSYVDLELAALNPGASERVQLNFELQRKKLTYNLAVQNFLIADADNDTVSDENDQCPNTPAGLEVDVDGCALVQLDSDNDGVNDSIDQCPDTPLDTQVDVYGCIQDPPLYDSGIQPINFETDGTGADYIWNVFENADNPALEVVDNPVPGGINSSAKVAKFTAKSEGMPWAGTESVHGYFGPITLGPSNNIVKIMVYKSVISDVGIKFADPSGGAQGEIKVANTVTTQWEELTFDFSGYIGLGNTSNLDQIIVFPDFDFAGREQDNIVYFDNIRLYDTGDNSGGGTGDDGSGGDSGGDTGSGNELVANGGFDGGISGWNGGTVADDGTGNNVFMAEVATAGPAWSVNLSQVLSIIPEGTYRLSFKAKASVDRSIIAGIGLNHDPWSATVETVGLSTDWQNFSFYLTAAGFGDDNSRVLFDMGAETGTVYLDDISLTLGSDSDSGGDNNDQLFGVELTSADSVTFFVNTPSWAIVHYIVNGGPKQNVTMEQTGDRNVLLVEGLNTGDSIEYFFTYEQESGGAIDTETLTTVVGEDDGNGGNGGGDTGGGTENVAPVLQNQPVTSIDADEAYAYQLDVTDANGDTITYAAISLPTWLSLSDAGLISGTPNTSHIGQHTVSVSFSDGEFTEELTYTLRVNESYLLEPPTPYERVPVDPNDPSTFSIIRYGAGSISDAINPDGWGCVYDYGTWINSAGVTEPGVNGCDPIGAPTYLHPQVIGDIASDPVPTHKWWGSVSFQGEMAIGDPSQAAYITPDPIVARISNVGVRLLGIPSGMQGDDNKFLYAIPDPFSEVFDGIAIANSDFDQLDAYLKDYSDGSVTVQWQSGNKPVMEATFVHGSPYAYFKAYRGQIVVKTKALDGPEKGTFYQQGNSLGVWTSVAGNRNDYLITGEGTTTFSDAASNAITVSNAANEITVALLPQDGTGAISDATSAFFATLARNVVRKVDIGYNVNRSDNSVTVTHRYLGTNGNETETLAGLLPMAWKNSGQAVSDYKVRSARGVVKFSQTSTFSYQLPFVGVLPHMPSMTENLDQNYLAGLVQQYLAKGPDQWNRNHEGHLNFDTYWSGKSYGRIAEIAAIARSIGLETEANTFIDWLKTELEDWFTADTNGNLDTEKYFVYDEEWTTLLGMRESFASHQQLNDHHFHYGYFVRAAAEVCRVDPAWCGTDQYGPMIELLIRDYAASKNDAMFPYLRNFDPANGFSWASGNANFALGNNNESTSEAANAYGAIVLYGLITGNDALVEKGMYLHASSTSAYWEYWNNIDRYRNASADYPDRGNDYDNFPADYNRLTTSIIWGTGSSFSTWFSGAYAHILGIQGLPLNPLVFHVGQYPDYMKDYVSLGLEQSSNGKPSGLANNEWRDIWWNLWAITDAEAAFADYQTMALNYNPENGETEAHTYQWIKAWQQLGHLKTGSGELTADHPAAVAFDKNGSRTYIAYNYSGAPITVNFSDGQTLVAEPGSFALKTVEGAGEDTGGGSGDGETGGDSGDQLFGVEMSSESSLTFYVNTPGWAVAHYIVNGGGQQNVSMQQTGTRNELLVSGLDDGDTVEYFFTYELETGGAVDSAWQTLVFDGDTSGGDSGGDTGGGNGSSGEDVGTVANDPDSNWSMVWNDEFDGADIDLNKWEHEVNCNGGGNNERQCYTASPENSFLDNGILKIVARQATGLSQPFTSARLRTKYQGDWTYGRIEVRAKPPQGQGSFPAIWMLPTDNVYGGWPHSGEIDIFESVNLKTPDAQGHEENKVHGNLWYGRSWPNQSNSGSDYELPDAQNPADGFHTYALEWEAGEIRWYVDGILYQTQRKSELIYDTDGDAVGLSHKGWFAEDVTAIGDFMWNDAPYDQRFHLLLNFAVGGNWAENVNNGGIDYSAFNDSNAFEFDYVRVYECSVDPLTGKGCAGVQDGYDAPKAESGTLVEGLAPTPIKPSTGVAEDLILFEDVMNDSWPAWNCCDAIEPQVVTDDAEHGQVVEFAIGATPTVVGFNTNVAATPALYDGSPMEDIGVLEFDLKLVAPSLNSAATWNLKVEQAGQTSEASVKIDTPTSAWTHYSVPLKTLQNRGLNLNGIDVIMIFPDWGMGEGAVFRVDNLRIVQGDTTGGSDGDDDPVPGEELVNNGAFENGTEGWIGAVTVNTEDGNSFFQADVAVAGNPWDVNLSQVMTITPETTYQLTFRAKASAERSIIAGIGLNAAPWTNVNETVALTTEWVTYSYELTAAGFGDSTSRVLFDLGAEIGSVFIDDVSLVVMGDTGTGGDDGSVTEAEFLLLSSTGESDINFTADTVGEWSTGSLIQSDVLYEGLLGWQITSNGSWGTVLALQNGIDGDFSLFNKLEIKLATTGGYSSYVLYIAANGVSHEITLPIDESVTSWQSVALDTAGIPLNLSAIDSLAVFGIGGTPGVSAIYITDLKLVKDAAVAIDPVISEDFVFITSDPAVPSDLIVDNDNYSDAGNVIFGEWSTGTLINSTNYVGLDAVELTAAGGWGAVLALQGDISDGSNIDNYDTDFSQYTNLKLKVASQGAFERYAVSIVSQVAGNEVVQEVGFSLASPGEWNQIDINLAKYGVDLANVSQIAVFGVYAGGPAGQRLYITDMVMYDTGRLPPEKDSADDTFVFFSSTGETSDLIFDGDNFANDGNIEFSDWSTGSTFASGVTHDGRTAFEITKGGGWGAVLALMGDIYGDVQQYKIDVSAYSTLNIGIAATGGSSEYTLDFLVDGAEFKLPLTVSPNWSDISIDLAAIPLDLSKVTQIAIFGIGGNAGDMIFISDLKLVQ